MKTPLSRENPFEYLAKGFLWEMLKQQSSADRLHLDFGAHDGAMLKVLSETGVIGRGVGLDLNADVVQANQSKMPPNVQLKAISKNAKLEFPDATFDSISMIGVLEHIADQESVLKEFNRVLKPEGLLVINVPGQHLFSFLDMGNWKFRFPRLHKAYYVRRHSLEQYEKRYVEKRNGMVGDIEVEKGWHQHFRHEELSDLLATCGFEVDVRDGYGFFNRPIINARHFAPKSLHGPFNHLERLDSKLFHSAEIFVRARKSKRT